MFKESWHKKWRRLKAVPTTLIKFHSFRKRIQQN